MIIKNKNKLKNIDSSSGPKDILTSINSEFGNGTILKLNTENIENHPRWVTGLRSLDYILGGGFPKGRIVEFYGPEGTGKTTLALQICKSILSDNTSSVVYIDAEYALNYDYCVKIGIDFERFFICQTQIAEEVLKIIKRIVEQKLANFIVVDSVAALIPESEIENVSDFSVASLARILSTSLKKLTSVLSQFDSSILFINQLRSNVTMFGSGGDITTGGKSLKYHSSVRMEMISSTKIKDSEGKITGAEIIIKTTKNKFFPPFRPKRLELEYGIGFDPRVDILNQCLEQSVIVRNGAWYSFDGENIAKGRDAMLQCLSDNNLLEKVLARVKE